ncbi:hypothetical protein M569_06683 [Genlisea aurea]|uniref:Uncharacterized protein n=1 Tax=Genlisea aurea TaxID=192259 RepID=S8CT82_9LAMI|nr:hypothetical protein M569_06683 [Genlisea aurea]
MNNNGGFPLSPSATPNFDNLLLQSLLSRLNLRHPPPPPSSSDVKSLEDLLLADLLGNLSESGSDSEDEESKSQLAKEESKLEKEIIRTILSGDIEKLKPNSGETVSFGEHHVCVGFQEETGSDYRVWEWHGHIVLFDEDSGYMPEYIYGNYFEMLGPNSMKLKKPGRKIDNGDHAAVPEMGNGENLGNKGLKELIECKDSGSERIIHRNLNANPGLKSFT